MSMVVRSGLVVKMRQHKVLYELKGTFGGTDCVDCTSKKQPLIVDGDRTKTDTGR